MNAVRISISDTAVARFRRLPRQKQQLLKDKVAAMLEQELAQTETSGGNLSDFQSAMGMSDTDMVLTFGEDYLNEKGRSRKSFQRSINHIR